VHVGFISPYICQTNRSSRKIHRKIVDESFSRRRERLLMESSLKEWPIIHSSTKTRRHVHGSFPPDRRAPAALCQGSLPKASPPPLHHQALNFRSNYFTTLKNKLPILATCNNGGSYSKPAAFHHPRLRHEPHRTAPPSCPPHDIRLHNETYATTAGRADSWSYSGPAKWTGDHNGGCFPSKAKVECGRRCGA